MMHGLVDDEEQQQEHLSAAEVSINDDAPLLPISNN